MLRRDDILHNLRETSDGFNKFIVEVGFSLASNIKDSDESPCSLIKGQFSLLCSFEPPSARSHFIKEIIDYIIDLLTHICMLYFQSGVIPHEFEIAKVIPLYKSGDPNNFSNYRPISILPFF